MHVFKENIRSRYGKFSSALGAESSDKVESAAFVDSKDYDLIVGQGIYSNCSSGTTLTLTMLQATDAAGGGSKTITGASATARGTGVTDVGVVTAQVRPAQLDIAGGFYYVGVRLDTSQGNGTETVQTVLHQCRGRFGQATPPA